MVSVSGATVRAQAGPVSVFDLFRIGIGPSSSHTVGPMRAGRAFARELADEAGAAGAVARLDVALLGSLGATGRGHGTDRAVVLGLQGADPQTVPVERVDGELDRLAEARALDVPGVGRVPFRPDRDIRFEPRRRLPYHVNALVVRALDPHGREVLGRVFYSVGGGFVMEQVGGSAEHPVVRPLEQPRPGGAQAPAPHRPPWPFRTATQLMAACEHAGLDVAGVVRADELATCAPDALDAHLDRLAATMFACIRRGCETSGVLPGGLGIRRRAPALAARLRAGLDIGSVDGSRWLRVRERRRADPLIAMDWVNLFALAVNEENAAGHRVVTAPTNGAAGVVPAVLAYVVRFCMPPDVGGDGGGLPAWRPGTGGAGADAVHDFLLAATAVGGIIKRNASIAGAEVGCQGEIGSAAAMAAAGLAQALGGAPRQVENAAEIAMEHSLGLTCDPVGGLVQVPCIERNAIAAVHAINAARMALWGDGRHTVSLDAVVETMRQTGADMLDKYKETSAGGLAVNVVEC